MKIEKYLSDFENAENENRGLIKNSIHLNFNQYSKHIIFSGLIHGNEWGSLPAFLKLIDDLKSKKISFGGKVTFLLGNKEAALKNLRYIDYDLNRSFSEKSQNENHLERKRALEIIPLLKEADILFDFHQTIQPTLHPFFIFAMHKESYYWARSVGNINYFITRKPNQILSNEGLCSDEFMHRIHKPAITIELSQKGYNENAQKICYEIMKNALLSMDKMYKKEISIKKIALNKKDLFFLERKYTENFTHPKNFLENGLVNLKKIESNKILGYKENGEKILSPITGNILFPQYPERNKDGEAIKPSSQLFTLVKKIKKHPLNWV